MSIDDIDLFEVNEAFASVPTAWLKTTGADPAKLNVNGGAIALGHPLGGSGTKLMTTLINALKQRNKRYGLQTMCEGGGMANVTIVERPVRLRINSRRRPCERRDDKMIGNPPMPSLPDIPLPSGIRSRFVEDINGLRMHVLEAGFETGERPCVLLLHGFPELSYSWRKVMPALAEAGYHVVAPDQRGYGRTTGWDGDYDGDLNSFRLLNLVHDALGLVSAFGYRSVAAVVGHDFGSSVAAWCALVRPDVFRSVVLMSAPFAGPPPIPFNTADKSSKPKPEDPVHRDLAALPRPRKHYQWYYSTREPMRICIARRKAYMISCAPTIITRAPTGKPTSPTRCRAGPRPNWQSSRPIM